MFVPRGCEPTPEWLSAHPGAIRIPAVMVPRDPQPGESGTQWRVQLVLPHEPATAPASPAPEITADFAPVGRPVAGLAYERPSDARAPREAPGYGKSYYIERDAIAAWRAADVVFAD